MSTPLQQLLNRGLGAFFPPALDPAVEQEFLQQRLDAATPLELEVFEGTGVEPGLDRALFLPFAQGPDGQTIRALPELIAAPLKAAMAPGAALRGVPISDQEVVETAFEVLGGAAARPGIDVGTDVIAGMAARPKFANVRGPNAYRDLFEDVPRELDPEAIADISDYSGVLQNELMARNVDQETAARVARKAELYFTRDLGTADDPIREAILKGDLTPRSFDDDTLGAETLAELRDLRALSTREMTPEFMSLLRDNPESKILRAQFERQYDRAAGVRPYIYGDPEFDVTRGAGERLYQQMIEEGVDPMLITNRDNPAFNMRINMPPRVRVYDRDVVDSFNPTERRSLPENLRQAIQNQEPVFEVDPTGFSQGMQFLDPVELAEKLKDLPKKRLEKSNFPQLVVAAEKVGDTPGILLKKRAQEVSSEAARRNAEAAGARGEIRPFTQDEREAYFTLDDKLSTDVTKQIEFDDKAFYRLDSDFALAGEASAMNNSVAGYAAGGGYPSYMKDAFADGSTQVFSLRRNDGRSLVTTDVSFKDLNGNPRKSVLSVYGYGNGRPRPQDELAILQLWDSLDIPHENARANLSMVEPRTRARSRRIGLDLQRQYAVYRMTKNDPDGPLFLSSEDAFEYLNRPPFLEATIDEMPDDFAEGGIVSLANGGKVEHGIVTL